MKNSLLLFALIMLIMSCKNSTAPKEEHVEGEDINKLIKDLSAIQADFRNPAGVADFLQLSGTRFMPELINAPMNYEYYKENIINSAANIGVYLADGLYQIGFDKKYEGYLSLAAAKQLAIDVGIGEMLEEVVLDRYSGDEYPIDSILNLARLGLGRSETILSERGQNNIFAALLVGNYIEKLNILLTNIFEYPIDLPEESKLLVLREMIVFTSEQLKLLPDVITLVEEYKKTDEPYLLKELKAIQTLLEENVLTDSELEKLKPEMIFENEDYIQLHKKVAEVRAFIVATE